MNIGERIKKLRKELNLTQQTFGEKIRLKQNSIAIIESGKRDTSDQTIFAICREFNVNETWLRDGVGEMFLAQDGSIISQMSEQYHLDEKTRALVESFLTMPECERDIVVAAFERAAEAVQAAVTAARQDPPAAQDVSDSDKHEPELDPDIEAEVEKIRARLYAREKTRRVLSGSTATANYAGAEKSRP